MTEKEHQKSEEENSNLQHEAPVIASDETMAVLEAAEQVRNRVDLEDAAGVHLLEVTGAIDEDDVLIKRKQNQVGETSWRVVEDAVASTLGSDPELRKQEERHNIAAGKKELALAEQREQHLTKNPDEDEEHRDQPDYWKE